MGQNHSQPPLSSHGLFPTIVAIWFAALFGLGCLVLPAVLLERLADTSGIAKLVPAAAPPLGFTARILFSVAAGALGALLGFAIARRVAAAQAERLPAPRQRPARNAVRPILVKEELGEALLDVSPEPAPAMDPSAPLPGRKRALTPVEEPAPGHFLQSDPLPDHPARWDGEHPLMPSAQTIAAKAIALDRQELDQPAAEPTPVAADEPALPEAAPREVEAAPAAEQPAPAQPQRPTALLDPLRALLAGQAAPVDAVAGPLEKLGVAQLAERLARSMQQRGDAGKPTRAVPSALRPFAAELEEFGEDEDDGEPASLAPAPAPAPAPVSGAMVDLTDANEADWSDEDAGEDSASANYSSLLAIKSSAPAPGAGTRAFDAPAPDAAERHKARLDPAETDRALRSALATLQRMSGAA